MQKIAVVGADGRMGRALLEAAIDCDGVELAGAVVQPTSCHVGADIGELIGRDKTGVFVSDDINSIFLKDVTVADFTVPAASLAHLSLAEKTQTRLIIGTTGFSEEQLQEISTYKDKLSFVLAGNYSVGVNLTLQLVRMAAKTMGQTSDIEVLEAHHKHKVDAPSGTALMMGEAVADALNVKLSDVGVFTREGITGAREPGSIGFSTIRGGDIVGEHTVLFCSEGERVEIAHKASSRQTYARGALRAARWLKEKSSVGMFSMSDVLGFDK